MRKKYRNLYISVLHADYNRCCIRMGFPGAGVVVSTQQTETMGLCYRILWLSTGKRQWEFATDLEKVEK